jgi:hypothetical protein
VNAPIPGLGGASERWAEVDGTQDAVVTGWPGSPGRPGLSTAWNAALEHEARGLLNLITIASRCREATADEGDRETWCREIRAARDQLEGLCRAGLRRNFLEGH